MDPRRRPDRTDVIVATQDESYEEFAATSELGQGERVSDTDLTAFGQ